MFSYWGWNKEHSHNSFSSSLLLSINLWSSLLIINHLKMLFPRYERFQQPEEDQPQPEDPVGCQWLEPGICSLHKDGGHCRESSGLR